MEQLRIFLAPEEYQAVFRLSEAELRSVERQVRWIVRQELQLCGLLQHEAEEGARLPQAEAREAG